MVIFFFCFLLTVIQTWKYFIVSFFCLLFFSDPCASVTCNTPPDQCFTTPGTCTAGHCAYPHKTAGTVCTEVANGVCSGSGTCVDPCAGVICNSPPNTDCYQPAGTCNAGTCEYTKKSVSTACQGNGNTCDASGTCVGKLNLFFIISQKQCHLFCVIMNLLRTFQHIKKSFRQLVNGKY